MSHRSYTAKKAVDQVEFYIYLGIGFIAITLIKWFLPDSIPFSLFQFWRFDWDWSKLANVPWFLMLVVPILAFITLAVTKNPHWENIEITASFGQRLATSIKAGIFEEIGFRYILFYFAVFMFYLDQLAINWLGSVGYINAVMSLHWALIVIILIAANIIGVIGFALFASSDTGLSLTILGIIIMILVGLLDVLTTLLIAKWWFVAILIPVTNFITFGKLSTIFAMYWTVGAGMISVNGDFRKGHIYQGLFGQIHSWVIGMLMFWFMFNFGLLAAMLLHALFDVTMDLIITSDAAIELANR